MLGKWTLMILCGVTVFGQSNQDSCVLNTAKNGDVGKIRGEAFVGGHDTLILPTSCVNSPSNRIILVWADDPSLAEGRTVVRRDDTFSEFTRLLKATFPLPPNSVGVGQRRYHVVADFKGRLEVSPSGRLKRAPTNKKVIGLEGFGHPMPFTRFRLQVNGVSQVEPKEQRPIIQQERGR